MGSIMNILFKLSFKNKKKTLKLMVILSLVTIMNMMFLFFIPSVFIVVLLVSFYFLDQVIIFYLLDNYKEFALLAMIGATKRQIKFCLIWQILVFGLIGILTGFGSSVMIIYLRCLDLNQLLMIIDPFRVIILLFSMLIVIMFVMILMIKRINSYELQDIFKSRKKLTLV